MNINEILKSQDQVMNKPLADLIKTIDNYLEDSLAKTLGSFDDKLKIGYNEQTYSNEIAALSDEIEAVNFILKNYYLLLKGKEISLVTIQEIYSLPVHLNPKDLEIELKKLYLSWNNIQIPGVTFKMDKLIDAYDFPNDIQSCISNILKAVHALDGPFKIKNINEFYEKATSSLVITQKQQEEIRERHATYMSDGDIIELFQLHMLCEALNGLSSPTYSFRNLPEIDFRLMKRVKVNTAGKLTLDHSYSSSVVKASMPVIGRPKLNLAD